MWNLNKIPRIAHFYWGRNKNLSYLRYISILSFKKFNPEWKILLHSPKYPSISEPTWDSKEQKGVQVPEDYYEKLINSGVTVVLHDFKDYGYNNNVHEIYKNDYLRWLVLYKLGGLWSDTDIIYIKPIEELSDNISDNKDCDTFLCRYPTGANAIGFLMSSGNNKFFGYIHEISKKVSDPNNYQAIGSFILNRLLRVTEFNKEFYPGTNFLMLDYRSVYSINCEHNAISYFYKPFFRVKSEEGVIGFHWYGGDPISQQFEFMLNEDNYKNFRNVISDLIGRVA